MMHVKVSLILVIFLSIAFFGLTDARKKNVNSLAPSNKHLSRFERSATRSCDRGSCRCRTKRTLVCSKTNCLKNLSTRSVSKRRGRHIETILITRQNNFTHVKLEDFVGLPNLRSIRFFNNGIKKIDENAFEMSRHVERLDLHRNKLKEIPDAIRKLPHLKVLNLGANMIRTIPEDAFDYNPKLEFLILRRNVLLTFPSILPRGLVKLSLGSNQISDIPDIRYLNRLKILRIESNELGYINTGALPQSLEVLSLCKNRLSSSQTFAFDKLPRLRRLKMAGNREITEIKSELFSPSANPLIDLNLRDCGIAHIDAGAFHCFPRLRFIDLRGNKLETYNEKWFVFNHKITRLSLSDNPWHCDCAFKYFLSDLAIAAGETVSRRDAKIRNPRYKMETFKDDFKNITCSERDSNSGRSKENSRRLHLNEVDELKSCVQSSTRWHFKPSMCNLLKAFPRPGVRPTFTRKIVTTTSRTLKVSSATVLDKVPTTSSTSTIGVLIPSTRKATTTPTISSPATTTSTKSTTTSTLRTRSTTTTTRKPTSTTRTTRRPTSATTRTTRRPTTATTTTTRRPTTTTTTTTTRRPTTTTTTTTRRPTTTTTTTTRRPTTTTTTTTRRPTTTTTTTTRRPTTTTTTTTRRPITTTTTTTTSSAPGLIKDSKRICTPSGDCAFPFTKGGVTYDGECVSYWKGNYCYVDDEGNWDYCQECED